jgi:hypothetical protein
MRFLGACVGTALVAAVAGVGGAGCHAGAGTLTGEGGAGTLSGAGGRPVGGGGGASVVLGVAGAGPATGVAGNPYNCGATTPAARVPAKIMIVLDTSASMNDAPDGSCTGGCGSGSKWSAVAGGIDAALEANGSPVEWGLRFIGSVADSCNTGALEAAVAPNNAAIVTMALRRHTAAGQVAIAGNRPTRAALNAGAAYLQALTSPGRAAIVLMTDGQPNCDLGEPGAGDVAGTLDAIAAARTDGIPTVVVGIGALDPATDDALSIMAIAGGVSRTGTPAYYPVADASDVVDTINQVVATVGACTYAVPPAPTNDGTTSRGDISVFADGKQVPQAANDGWTYTDATQTAITFNGSSCNATLSGTDQQVMIAFHCPVP